MVPIPTPIYHITCVDNLASILTAGGLYAKNQHQHAGISYTNIAHQSIQDRRFQTQVTCEPRGNLHDYVPFYFAPRSPMLYTIHQGNVEGYAQGQKSVIHLVSTAQVVQAASHKFVFTDRHSIVRLANFLDNLKHLNKIDWKVMNSQYWFNNPEHNDRKERRQAEFLVYQSLPWNLVTQIGVINDEMKRQVEKILQDSTHRPTVVIRQDWYYTKG